MNAIAEARAVLVAELGPQFPDRQVLAYRPDAIGVGTPPRVWIDDVSVTRSFIGNRTRVILATFPVFVVVDGATESASAMLDASVSAVWDTVEAMQAFEPVRSEPRTLDPRLLGATTAPGTANSYRCAVVVVDVTLTARTLCAPQPEPVTVPPQMVPNGHPATP